jgi:WhiB family redox-sensing transcriptional regulator
VRESLIGSEDVVYLDAHWTAESACLELDPELFFPVGEKGAAVAQMEHARAICRACPVRTQCLQLALQLDAQHGMWGGMTPLERNRIRRRVNKQARSAVRRPEPVPVEVDGELVGV